MKKNLVSIILPVYNGHQADLQTTMKSILQQSYQQRELLIINDASTNGIWTFLKEYAKQDARIVYIENETNLRLTRTLNKGLELSHGEFIARIDDEDIWTDPYKLEKQIHFLRENPEYWICGTNATAVDTSNNPLFLAKKPESDEEIRNLMLSGTQLLHVSVVFRKEAILQVGNYDSKWDYVEDHELWLRIGQKYKLHNLQDNAVTFKIDPCGISGKNRRKQRLNILKLSIQYRKFYPKFWSAFLRNILHYGLSLLPLSFSLALIKRKNDQHSPH